MKSERTEAREQQILAKLRNRPRLEGQHVTETIYCNVKAWAFARLGASGDIPPTPFDDAALLRMLIGTGMGDVLEQGHVSQIQTISPDTDDVGTIDVWFGDHPVEIKVSYLSTRKDIAEQDHWLQQLGEYVWRSTKRERKTPWGELWIVHLLGDHGAKQCPVHGRPESVVKRKHPDTDRPRLVCPECYEFLADGDRETALRCHRLEWTWDELSSLHSIHAWRQGQLQQDILHTAYQPSTPPPIRWGYDFECRGCPVKERVGCPGRQPDDTLEEDLLTSIQNLQEVSNG